MSAVDTSLATVGAAMMDDQAPLDARIRALYILKDKHRNLEGAKTLIAAVDTTVSVLLQHEFLYNVGQFGFVETIPDMNRIAGDTTGHYNEVSRHEAIEAIGAIGDESSIDFLNTLTNPEAKETAPIVESCVLAIRRILKKKNEGDHSVAVPKGCEYSSVDPTPAETSTTDVSKLSAQLQDEKADIWDRYTAMFALRNIGDDASVKALSDSLRSDTVSCLFRHEVAFVLGQMEKPSSQAALIASVKDEKEHPMVRHEAAEALGALADKESQSVLEEYAQHPEPLVKDSCVVALEMHKYWTNFMAKKSPEDQA